MSDLELDYGSDQEVSANHSKLLEAVSKLDRGQRVKKPQRSEPSLEVSEFHLVKSGISDNDAVRLDDLAKTLGIKGHHAAINQKFRAAQQKAKVLPKPLEKPAADKLKRQVGFENTKKDLEAWNAIVSRNRMAESLSFPLNQPSMRLEPSDQFVKRFRLQSDLEKELAALEPSKPVEEEKVDEFPLTLGEIMQRRKDAARFRAQQSYKEAKAHRQNKIKSKKFHRILRKAKIKQQMKEFEELQKTDPAAALEKLEQLDKSRAEERMSLRHKSTGQWAKSKQIRAKYDKESRQVLAQQLSISKALTQKVRSNDDSDAEDESANQVPRSSATDKDNPWVNGIKTESEIDDFITGYRKYWEDKNSALKVNGTPTNALKTAESCSNEKNTKISKRHAAVNPVESVTEEYTEQNEDQTSISKNPKPSKNPSTMKSSIVGIHSVDSKMEEFADVSPLKNVKSARGKILEDPAVSMKNGKKTKIGKIAEHPVKAARPRKAAESRKAGTSQWSVEELLEDLPKKKGRAPKSLKIDDLFESMEDKLISRIDTKLKNVKRKLASNAAAYKSNEEDSRAKYSADLSFKKRKMRPDIDEELEESTGISGNQAIRKSSTVVENLKLVNGLSSSKTSQSSTEIDPNKFINVKPKHLKTQLPDTVTGGDEALDDSEGDEDQHNIISEAFADDDVVDEFRKEKAEEIKKSQPEDLDLRLPGWGCWGGKSIIQTSRKKRRFIMKFPKEAQRRDENKGDVIIIEEKDPKIKEHQVSDLPYPFNSVKDFEASIRAPIGRNFVPENAHKRFIRPAVKTKLGEIIEPMDAESLVKKNPHPRKRTGKMTKKCRKTQQKIEI